MREKIIAIIGCGQMGSRHLQALAKLEGPLHIEAVEPSSASRLVAVQRFQEVSGISAPIVLTWHANITELPEADLTIVASNAPGRSKLLQDLVGMGHRRFLIEKMVCQSQEEYRALLETFEASGAKGWVNCARPYFPFYEKIIRLLQREGRIQFSATAGNLGLGCNAVHLLALFQTVVGFDKGLRLNGDYLFPELLPNKRGGDLIEFAGTVLAQTDAGDIACIDFHPGSSASVVMTISSANCRFIIDEGCGKAFSSFRENQWHWEDEALEIVPSSKLTGTIVQEIFASDGCKLPTLRDCHILHKELFRIFNGHVTKVTGKYSELCPIT